MPNPIPPRNIHSVGRKIGNLEGTISLTAYTLYRVRMTDFILSHNLFLGNSMEPINE
jgi:hypothetical protein